MGAQLRVERDYENCPGFWPDIPELEGRELDPLIIPEVFFCAIRNKRFMPYIRNITAANLPRL